MMLKVSPNQPEENNDDKSVKNEEEESCNEEIFAHVHNHGLYPADDDNAMISLFNNHYNNFKFGKI